MNQNVSKQEIICFNYIAKKIANFIQNRKLC
jgi:hypothetical protein